MGDTLSTTGTTPDWRWNLPPARLPGQPDPATQPPVITITPQSVPAVAPVAPPAGPAGVIPGTQIRSSTVGGSSALPSQPSIVPAQPAATAPPGQPFTTTPPNIPPGPWPPLGAPGNPFTVRQGPTRSWMDPTSPSGRRYAWPDGSQSPYYGPNDPGRGPFANAGPAGRLVIGSESRGQNVPGPMTSSGQAQGYFQITTGTWRDFAQRAGVNLQQYPDALHAPYAVQQRVAETIPMARWEAGFPAVKQQYPWATGDMTLGEVNQLAGTRQTLIPAAAREPGEWGRPDATFGSAIPGMMPQAHDVPSIMQGVTALAAIASMNTRLPLGMLAGAFGAFLKARNARQVVEEKNQKTQWQDALKESAAQQQMESQLAGEAFAAYGDNPDGLGRALASIASRFGDTTMLGALQEGGIPAVERLQQERDKYNQPLQKLQMQQEKMQLEEQKFMFTNEIQMMRLQEAQETNDLRRQQIQGKIQETQQKLDAANAGLAAWGEQPAAGAAPPAATEAPPSAPATPPDATEPTAAATPPPAGAEPSPSAAPAGPPADPTASAPAAPAPAATPAGGAPSEALPPVTVTARAPQAGGNAVPEPPGLTPAEKEMGLNIVRGGQAPSGSSLPPGVVPKAEAYAQYLQNRLDGIVGSGQSGADVYRSVDQIDPSMGNILRDMTAGRIRPPQVGFGGAGRNFVNSMTALAHAADPNYDTTLFQGRQRIREDYSPGGKAGTTLLAANRMAEAARQVIGAVQALGPNAQYPSANAWAEWLAGRYTGDARYTNLFTAWRQYVMESVRVARQGTGNEGDIQAQANATPPAASPAQILGALKIDTANADYTIQSYRDYWKQQGMPGEAPGYSADAAQTFRHIINSTPAQLLEANTPVAAPSSGWGKVN